jgi:hypothetical protein
MSTGHTFSTQSVVTLNARNKVQHSGVTKVKRVIYSVTAEYFRPDPKMLNDFTLYRFIFSQKALTNVFEYESGSTEDPLQIAWT